MNKCPKCGCQELQNNGSYRGVKKKRCKKCGYQFSRDTLPGVPLEKKKLALHMYLEGLGFRAIGRILGVSNVAVLNWVKEAAEKIQEIHQQQERPKFTPVIELDEMWHFVGKKNKSSGSGWLMIEVDDESWAGKSGIVTTTRAENSSNRLKT